MNNIAEVIPMRSVPEEKQTPNPAWAFNLDPVHSWAYWDNAFTKEECERIIELGNSRTQKQATTRAGDISGVRKSEVAWLYPSDDLDWAYRRLTDVITSLNERFFKFDLFGATEGFQFTKYAAPGGKYGKHIDLPRCVIHVMTQCSIRLNHLSKGEVGSQIHFFLSIISSSCWDFSLEPAEEPK